MNRPLSRNLAAVVPCFLVLLTFLFAATGSSWRAPSRNTLMKMREQVLRYDLMMMREAIDNYTLDKQQPPQSLQDLVDAGYLREVPVDPLTSKKDWVPIVDDVVLSSKLTARGVTDVHSTSGKLATNGTPLNTW
jgi:general secretion pathway protein G